MSSTVNHPQHYNQGKIEVIEFIEDKNLNFHRGNAVKYIARAGVKDPNKEVEDLQKAIWYLEREIEVLKAEEQCRETIRPNDMNTRKVGADPALGAPYGDKAQRDWEEGRRRQLNPALNPKIDFPPRFTAENDNETQD